jgi:predicted nucleic acid-binding protein
MTIISNTSPISNLAVIGQLPLLQQIYGNITIPQAVADEIAKVATIYTQAASLPDQSWITVQSVKDEATVQRLRGSKLDAGESEAIALALELNAELLIIDEQLGREIAVNQGLNVTGLLGALLEAKNKGLISKVKPIINDLMIQARFRIGLQLYSQILRLADEESVG